MVKYNPLPEGVPEGEGKGLYLTVYHELSPNTDIISFSQSLGQLVRILPRECTV